MIVTLTLAINHSMPTDTLPQLVQAAQKNPQAFSEIYHQFVHSVYRYTYGRIGNHQDAEDVTADIFADALNNLSRYRERGYFAAWLFRIARHRIADYHRQQLPDRLSAVPNLTDSMPLLATQVAKRELQQQLRTTIADLPPAKRELIALRFAAGLSFREIGKVVGKREGAVKMALRRTLDQLSAELEAYHG